MYVVFSLPGVMHFASDPFENKHFFFLDRKTVQFHPSYNTGMLPKLLHLFPKLLHFARSYSIQVIILACFQSYSSFCYQPIITYPNSCQESIIPQ